MFDVVGLLNLYIILNSHSSSSYYCCTTTVMVVMFATMGARSGCRMQFIFLYYDQNRNGRLEVEEVATMIEHIQQLHGESHSSAMVPG